ncbi:unnamed protein product [marine sediment metagenome]|uniref:Uncharacterized protein n=1 Tax=marine sediment metagenome TaxID=412755 RepID=X1CLN2_9ZZZZ
MNKNIEIIIGLSDCDWIQNKFRKYRKIGSWYFDKEFKFFSPVIAKYETKTRIKKKIWLPVGFNPESGRLQIADLITELNQIHPSKMDKFWDIHSRLIEIWGLIVK